MTGNLWLPEASTCFVLVTISCALRNLPFVRGESCDPDIKIRPVIKISSSSGNKTLPIGADITLTCKAEPRTVDKEYVDRLVRYIEWYDPQGRDVRAKCQQRQNTPEENFSCPLVLKNLTADEFGNYICQAGNEYKHHCTRKSFKIRILGAPLKLIGVPRDQSADIGANVTFNCTATGLPNPSISWIKNNDSFALQSNPRVRLFNYPLDDESIQSQLFITGVKKEDFGKYQCEAKNIVGKKLSLPAFFSPKDAQIPEIVEGPKNQIVSISSNAIFSCTAKGFPSPTIHWVKDNTSHALQSNPRARVIQDNRTIRSQLLITSVEMEDYGKYQCIANNSIGRGQSRVAVLKRESKNEEEDAALPMTTTALLCALVAALICLLAVLVWNQLRNRGEERRKSATKALLEKDKYLINRKKELESPNPIFIPTSEQRLLACTPDGSRQLHLIEDIEERSQERLDWGEMTTGGDNVTADGGVDLRVDKQGDWREISQETAEGYDNMENLEVLDEILGEGEFGIVYKGRYGGKDGNVTDVAVKRLKDPNASAKKALFNEIRTLKHAGKHPNIVTLVGTRIEGGSVLVVTELIRGDSLENLLKAKSTPEEWNKYHNVCCRLNDRQLVTIAFQIAKGMQHLEGKKFVHRDLAARNIFVDANFVAKVGDFGLARDISEAGIYTITSSGRFAWRWSSLESLRDLSFTSASDVWSFGIVLWEIATYGGLPYPDITSPLALVSQLAAGYRMPRPNQCSEELYELMSSCWKENPLMRPTFYEIAKQLKNLLREVKRTYINIREDNNGEV